MSKSAFVRIAGASAVALGVSVAFGLPAQAKDGGASAHGNCSSTSTYKLQVVGHKDSILVKVKVSTDVAGETWAYTIGDNGVTAVTGEATTSKNGKLTIRESIPNLDGADSIDLSATDSATGETCAAVVVLKP